MKKKKPLRMSKETRKRLKAVAELFKGKEMFPEAVARAKEMFKNMPPY